MIRQLSVAFLLLALAACAPVDAEVLEDTAAEGCDTAAGEVLVIDTGAEDYCAPRPAPPAPREVGWDPLG